MFFSINYCNVICIKNHVNLKLCLKNFKEKKIGYPAIYLLQCFTMLFSKCKFAFSGWEDVPHQDLNFVQNVFQFIPADDQKLAYDHFFQKLGKYT